MNTSEQPMPRLADSTVVLPVSRGRDLRRMALLTLDWFGRHGSNFMKRSSSRRLRLLETVTLGEKRFVSILQVDGEQFLLGGSGSALTVLARLEQPPSHGVSFADICAETRERREGPLRMHSEEFAE